MEALEYARVSGTHHPWIMRDDCIPSSSLASAMLCVCDINSEKCCCFEYKKEGGALGVEPFLLLHVMGCCCCCCCCWKGGWSVIDDPRSLTLPTLLVQHQNPSFFTSISMKRKKGEKNEMTFESSEDNTHILSLVGTKNTFAGKKSYFEILDQAGFTQSRLWNTY